MPDGRRAYTAVLAAGDFPRSGTPAARLFDGAARVICCDGAARIYRRRRGRWPDAIVGDLDSFAGRVAAGCEVVRIAEQETNDLEKAVRFCRERGWPRPIVFGAAGRRADHMLGNYLRAIDLGVEIVDDCGRFTPFCGRRTFRQPPGSAFSVFAPDPRTRMVSRGLVWPLDGLRFENLYCATLNRTNRAVVTLSSDRPAAVYIPHSAVANLPVGML